MVHTSVYLQKKNFSFVVIHFQFVDGHPRFHRVCCVLCELDSEVTHQHLCIISIHVTPQDQVVDDGIEWLDVHDEAQDQP